MTYSRRTLLAASIAALLALPGGAAEAAGPKLSVTVERHAGAGFDSVSFFEISARPGRRTAAGRIVVANGDDQPVVVDLDPVDAQTATNLGSAYDVRALRSTGPTRWSRLSQKRLTIAPGRKAAFHVSVAVPERQRAGEYLSGVAIQARGQRESATGGRRVAIASAQRYVIGLQVNVPGRDRPALRLAGARVERLPAGVSFLVRMRNAGNVVLKDVRGRVAVSRDGRQVASQAIGPGTFVSGTAIDFPVAANRERPRAGTRYRVRATVRYRDRIATLDEVVTFGSRQAKRQREYGVATSDDGRPSGWPIPAGAGLLAPLALLLAARRRRLPASRRAGLRLMERELAAVEDAGHPLSVALIGPVPVERAQRRQLVRQIQERLRKSDTLCELRQGELALIAPDTGPLAAAALGDDLERLLAGGDSAIRVRTRTATTPAASELVDWLLGRSHVPGPARRPEVWA
jgi:hypothetical protein